MPLPTLVDDLDKGSKNRAMDDGERQHCAELVRVGRAKLRMSKVAFARAVGIAPNTLLALERAAQEPEPATLQKVARYLGLTVAALTHGKRAIDAGDPRLAHLNDEDLDVAQAFHHAPMRVRQEVLGALQQRARRGTSTPVVNDLSDRILRLPNAARQTLDALISELEGATTAATVDATVPAGILHSPRQKGA